MSEHIPPNIKSALDLWVSDGYPPGSFCQAVLRNDLMDAFSRADQFSERAMGAIVRYVYNNMPSACHGSQDKMDAWEVRKMYEREARAHIPE